jgi:hypothetical protein
MSLLNLYRGETGALTPNCAAQLLPAAPLLLAAKGVNHDTKSRRSKMTTAVEDRDESNIQDKYQVFSWLRDRLERLEAWEE